MKRSLGFFSLLLILCWPTAFAQYSNDEIDSLVKNRQWEKALQLLPAAMSRDSMAGDWTAYEALAFSSVKAFYALKKYERAIAVIEETIGVLHNAGRKGMLFEAKLLLWKALLLRSLEKYSEVFDAYCKAIEVYENNNFNGPDLAYCYKNAAQIGIRWSNYNLANTYLQAAIRSDTTMEYGVSIYSQLANNAFWQDSFEKAERYFEMGRKLPERDQHAVASLKHVGSLLYLRQKHYSESYVLAQQAFAYYQTQPEEEGDNRIRTLTTLADIAAHQNKPLEAEQYYQKAEAEGKKFYHGKSREMAKLYVETGLFYEETGRPDRALMFYQNALIQAFPGFNSLNINDNPSVEDAWLESQAMRAAAAKALLLSRNKDIASRLNAAHCFDLSFAVATRLRRTYGNDADKFALAANNRDNYTAAALNLWGLWRETVDPAILARLFAFLEQTKAQALGDALQQQRALALTGIPDSLLKLEEHLRLEASIATKDLKEMELSGDSTDIIRLQDRAFRLDKEYTELLDALGKNYPRFLQYMQSGLAADLSDIQAALPDSTALLSWFDAGDRYLCVVARHGGLSGFEVERDSLFDGTLSRFLGTITDKSLQESDPASYFSEAHFIYKRLFPEAEVSDFRSLIIVPDGRLSYLPFEALLIDPYTGSYTSAPYLLRSKTVQYAWSATLLTLPETAETGDKGLLQIAPFIQTARDNLDPLPNSVHDTPKSVDATMLSNENATINGFLKWAPVHKVLHLSTHADAGGRGVPGIEFFDRRLTLPEIYAQRFHASLVSLSACETGKGQFAEGEGVLSLARAFAYAGAQSLVASLWSVNERSTAELFAAFYENLKNGMPKAEALRQAKLQHLASSQPDARKAPFHWAAFTITGADGQVDLTPAGWGWGKWWVLATVLVLSGVLFGRFYFFNTGKTTPDASDSV